MKRNQFRTVPWLCAVLLTGFVDTARPSEKSGTEPAILPQGALVIVGGGLSRNKNGADPVLNRFRELAGGAAAPIVFIPTANDGEKFDLKFNGISALRAAGLTNITILHTRDPQQANSESFVQPLKTARGVWIGGGRQWRLADAYLDTLVQKELRALLARGGVIGGTSAGASILASYLVRGAPEGNQVLMAKGHERGFGFLPDSAIDQHVSARGRQTDLGVILKAHPKLLGIGLDEATAIVVQGNTFEVAGKSNVFIHGTGVAPDAGKTFLTLGVGQRFNLKTRQVEK